ncbi:hypothetical protein ACU4GD_27870 [Cupriavidus basilensis]
MRDFHSLKPRTPTAPQHEARRTSKGLAKKPQAVLPPRTYIALADKREVSNSIGSNQGSWSRAPAADRRPGRRQLAEGGVSTSRLRKLRAPPGRPALRTGLWIGTTAGHGRPVLRLRRGPGQAEFHEAQPLTGRLTQHRPSHRPRPRSHQARGASDSI